MKLGTKELLTLSKLKGLGTKTLLRIGDYVSKNDDYLNGAQDYLDLLNRLKASKAVPRLGSYALSEIQIAMADAQQELDRCASAGVGVVGRYDKDYPKIFTTTVDEKGGEAMPALMYYKGDLNVSHMPGLAVIGTREATSEGIKAGEYLAGKFAEQGINIVSGLAIGCDTCGHRGALAVGGKTTAILANGLDSVYPSQNEKLAKEIVEKGGLLMSEYPLGSIVNRFALVSRDRLQAGLAVATLVVQTGVRGGTMHAATATLQAKKPLYVVRFKDEKTRLLEKSLGNDYLVRNGGEYISGDSDIKLIAERLKERLEKVENNQNDVELKLPL